MPSTPRTQITIGKVIFTVATAAVAISLPHDHSNEIHLLPTKIYQTHTTGQNSFLYQGGPVNNYLVGKSDLAFGQHTEYSPELPLLGTLRIKIQPPTPLEFTVVEDKDGFI